MTHPSASEESKDNRRKERIRRWIGALVFLAFLSWFTANSDRIHVGVRYECHMTYHVYRPYCYIE